MLRVSALEGLEAGTVTLRTAASSGDPGPLEQPIGPVRHQTISVVVRMIVWTANDERRLDRSNNYHYGEQG